jgi:hypothetical protein
VTAGETSVSKTANVKVWEDVPQSDECTLFVAHSSDGGRDSNSGTRSSPLATIPRAISAAGQGEHICVGPGRFGRFAVTKSNITIEGTRGDNGEWLTTIDPSVAMPTAWVKDSAHHGVYRASNSAIGFSPVAMITEQGKYISRVLDGFSYMTKPENYIVPTDKYRKVEIKYWDAFNALFMVEGGYTYVRFGNTDIDPNDQNLRVSNARIAIEIHNRDHVILRDLRIQGAEIGVSIEQGSSNNVLEDSHLRACITLVRVEDSDTSANLFRRNKLELNHLSSYKMGAWNLRGADSEYNKDYKVGVKEYYWELYKRGMGERWQHAYYFSRTGFGNVIEYNDISNVMAGLHFIGSGGLTFHHNRLTNTSGSSIYCGKTSGGSGLHFKVHDNLILDCHQNVRIFTPIDDLKLFIYRNRFWNPRPLEPIIFFTNVSSGEGRVYIYHNSLAEGKNIFAGTGATLIVNNIFSSRDVGASGQTVRSNWGDDGDRFWKGAYLTPPDFLVSSGTDPDAVRNAGIDLSREFTGPYVIEGETYRHLPGMTPGYGGSDNKPDLGAIPEGGKPEPVGLD